MKQGSVAFSLDDDGGLGDDLTLPSVAMRPPQKTLMERFNDRLGNSRGLILVAFSAFFFSLMSLCVSEASHAMPPMEITFVRATTQTIVSLVILLRSGERPFGPRGVRKYLILRGVGGTIGVTTLYYGLSVLSLGDATVLFFTAPIWTSLAGRVFLKEMLSKFHVVGAALSMVGIVFVSQPEFIFGAAGADGAQGTLTASARAVACIVVLAGAMGQSTAYLAIRKIGPGVHPLILVFYFGWVSALVSLIGCFFSPMVFHAPAMIWFNLFAACALAFIGQVLLNKGIQLEKAGPASLMRNLDVVLVFVWQVTIQRQSPNAWSFLGAVVVTFSVVLVAAAKWREGGSGGARKNEPLAVVDAVDEVDRSLLQLDSTEMSREDSGDAADVRGRQMRLPQIGKPVRKVATVVEEDI